MRRASVTAESRVRACFELGSQRLQFRRLRERERERERERSPRFREDGVAYEFEPEAVDLCQCQESRDDVEREKEGGV